MSSFSDHMPRVNWYLLIIVLSIKQNLNYAWILGPYTLDKLILTDIIVLSIEQNLSHAWSFGPHALSKLALSIYFSKCQNRS